MKKITLLLMLLGAFQFSSFSQAPEYDDLHVYFADGDFEKLLKVAEKYTTGDKTRKDAIPYLYLSKANFEISKGGDLLEKYPRAFKDAVKYAGKCIQKDKTGEVVEENVAHFTSLKENVFEQLRNLTESNDFGRLSGVIPLMEKIDKQDVGTAFLKSIAKYRRGDKGGFKTERLVAMEKLANLDMSTLVLDDTDDIDIANKKKIDRASLKFGILNFVKVLVEKGEKSEAKSLMNKIKHLFEEDKGFMREYNKL